MTADKEGDEHLFKHFFLPDDHAADLAHDVGMNGVKTSDPILKFGGFN